MMILKADNIHKKFPSGDGFVEVLRGASLELRKGELAILSGQSGSGKSTLLYVLAGLIRPDAGDVSFGGESVFDFHSEKLDKFRNGKIGFVFQMHHLMPDFTALENIMIPALIKGVPRDRCLERACELMSELSILHRKDHFPNQLSGGEQQRAAVARAMINSPEVLLADEPTGNLDQENAESLIKLMSKIVETSDVSVLIATHNPDFTKIGKKLHRLSEGRISAQ